MANQGSDRAVDANESSDGWEASSSPKKDDLAVALEKEKIIK